MSRIQQLFSRKKNSVLNIYLTAGYPRLESTIEVIKALEEAGVDLVELGMPYSDPLADGAVIQQSSTVAIANGMSIGKLLQQLENLRPDCNVPIILMGYMNPILQYGFENFCQGASRVGVDGLILPDLPEFEFESHYGPIIRKYGLDFIFLVTPETSAERIRQLDSLSTGFLYAVSSSSTTGTEKNMQQVINYLQRLQNMNLRNPVLVGFGIKDRQSFEMVNAYASGAIIGSAFVKTLENSSDPAGSAKKFVEGMVRGQARASPKADEA